MSANLQKNRTDEWIQALRLRLPSAVTKLGSASRVTVLDGKVKNNVKITTITYVGDLVCVGADALHRPAGLVDKNGWRQFMGRTIHPAVLLGEATGRCGLYRPV